MLSQAVRLLAVGLLCLWKRCSVNWNCGPAPINQKSRS